MGFIIISITNKPSPMFPSKYLPSILATEVNAWMDSLARASEGAPFRHEVLAV